MPQKKSLLTPIRPENETEAKEPITSLLSPVATEPVAPAPAPASSANQLKPLFSNINLPEQNEPAEEIVNLFDQNDIVLPVVDETPAAVEVAVKPEVVETKPIEAAEVATSEVAINEPAAEEGSPALVYGLIAVAIIVVVAVVFLVLKKKSPAPAQSLVGQSKKQAEGKPTPKKAVTSPAEDPIIQFLNNEESAPAAEPVKPATASSDVSAPAKPRQAGVTPPKKPGSKTPHVSAPNAPSTVKVPAKPKKRF